MIPFGSGLRTDSTVICSGRPWGRRAGSAPPGVAHILWALRAPFAYQVLLPCLDKSPTGEHKTTSPCLTIFVYSLKFLWLCDHRFLFFKKEFCK
ncbi:hypothetical protein [Desulforamulus hydrothermalis]|uniref:hypothetical protein n=1 Tax=Desulforamulus hydrothermalis TaxID=412895 RepID=UPI001EE477DE|nr:hypothetical protein [Desulforamulus hydrothermalis]